MKRLKKRNEYIDYYQNDFMANFSTSIADIQNQNELKDLLDIFHRYEYLFQIHDSISDLIHIKNAMDKDFIDLKSGLIISVRELSSKTLGVFDVVTKSLTESKANTVALKKETKEFSEFIEEFNRGILKVISDPGRQDAGAVIQIMTYSQRLKDKLVNFHKIYFHR
jgi:phosphate:Na+ symporter